MAAQRDSNIELLRIIATIMILMVHYSGWMLTLVQDTNIDSFWIGGTSMAVTRSMLNAASCIGVVLFVLISGYFSIKIKLCSLVNLFTCLAFFYIGSWLLQCYVNDSNVFEHHRLLRCFLAFSKENWFIQCYLFLMLLSPILNAFVEKVTEKQLAFYISVFIACAFYFGCLHNSEYFYFNGGYSVTTFIMIYLVGRYIKLYGVCRVKNTSSCLLLSVWMVCTVLISLGLLYLPHWYLMWSYCSPIQLISASFLFILFSRLNFKSAFVNWVGRSCLAAYIVHTSYPVFDYMIKIDKNLFLTENAFYYLCGGIVLISGVFVISILLDKIRLFIFSPLINSCNKIHFNI